MIPERKPSRSQIAVNSLFLGIFLVVSAFSSSWATSSDQTPLMPPAQNSGPSAARVSLQSETGEKENDDFKRDVHLMYRALQLVHDKYREDKPSRDLVYSAIRGMLQTLDPFTTFVEPKQSQEMGIKLKGEYGGLGIVISMKDNQLTVISPIDDTPAARAGIKALDKIIEIEGVSTRGITMDQALNSMRGEAGQVCRLKIQREGEKEPLSYEITRAIIKLRTVKWMMAPEPFQGFGYLRVTSFNGDTSAEFREGLSKLMERSPKGLVLDLRSNPGGLLNSAVDMASCLLPKGKLVVYTKGRVPNSNAKYDTTSDANQYSGPLVVLVNGSSASASEIVAGAVKDHNRGLLLGTRTFGKGSVQHIFPLFDGSSMVMTVAHYFTPGGTCIHEQGIEPHVTVYEPSGDEKKRIMEKETYWTRREQELERRKKLEDLAEGKQEQATPAAGQSIEVSNSPQGVTAEAQGVSGEAATEAQKTQTEPEDTHQMKADILEKDYQLRRGLELLRLIPQLGRMGYGVTPCEGQN